MRAFTRFLSAASATVLATACVGPNATQSVTHAPTFSEVFDGALNPLTGQYPCTIEDFNGEIDTQGVTAVRCFAAVAAGDIQIVRRSLLEALRSNGWNRPLQNAQNIFPIFTRSIPDHQCPQILLLRIEPGYAAEYSSEIVAEFYTLFLISDEPPCEDLSP
jgi:hypothetical protein